MFAWLVVARYGDYVLLPTAVGQHAGPVAWRANPAGSSQVARSADRARHHGRRLSVTATAQRRGKAAPRCAAETLIGIFVLAPVTIGDRRRPLIPCCAPLRQTRIASRVVLAIYRDQLPPRSSASALAGTIARTETAAADLEIERRAALTVRPGPCETPRP